MNKKAIVESIDEIQMILSADNVQCWESPYCPYCMLNELKCKIEKDINDNI